MIEHSFRKGNSSVDNVVIRELQKSDTDDISTIYASIIQTPVKTDFKEVIEKQLQSGKNASFVAELQGKVVGYMISYILTASFGVEKSAWIAMLGVDPKFMGQGIGAKLAREIFTFYKKEGIKYIYTSVLWDSTDLLSFFKTLGFDRSEFINLRKSLD